MLKLEKLIYVYVMFIFYLKKDWKFERMKTKANLLRCFWSLKKKKKEDLC